ncbi:metallophosphoesterase [Paramesorhizobium deserti]|uniref:Metallophosphoesterase n=1 Tax=Paramesorhizobium deserti TaxID=1494590 RepID=A0A135I208_9HYPH|nr:metallophosphoesterase [Paramesorhizobium deserti]
MKHIVFAFLIGSAAILQSFASSAPAEAAVLKNVSEYAGQRCNTPPRGSGVVVGIFHGVKESPFISDNDARVPVDRFRCFTSMEECQGWLYTMQTKYDAGIPTTSCRRR